MRATCPDRLPWLVPLALLLAVVCAERAEAQNPFRLKPGAAGALCFDCHGEFQDKLKAKVVHAPVKGGNCASCHSPHTSAHGKLLAATTSAVCATCHGNVIPAKAVSSHEVVLAGNCASCHDPHASSNKGLLLKAGNDLCSTCHKPLVDGVSAVKFKHMPATRNCLGCHNPHASTTAPKLLTKPVPALCTECHDPDGASFARQHVSYPVARADCTSCHDAHGSNRAGILFDTVHAPVAAKRCVQCHNAATAGDPFAVRRAGFELCRGCHSGMMNDTFGKSRVHWPLLDKTGCLNCHEPHASRRAKLLNVPETALCGRCHQDTVDTQARLAERAKQERVAAKSRPERGALTHEPVQAGDCSTCHSPHASDSTRLLRTAVIPDACGVCHDWLKHSSHPMGGKYVDHRNRNRTVDCLSCHRAHGTGNRYLMTFPTTTELCVQCHRQLRR